MSKVTRSYLPGCKAYALNLYALKSAVNVKWTGLPLCALRTQRRKEAPRGP